MKRTMQFLILVIAIFLVWQVVRPGTFSDSAAVLPDVSVNHSNEMLCNRLVAIYRVFPGVDFEIILAAFKAGKQYGIEPELLLAIAFTESSFRPGVINAGCYGLMGISAKIWKPDMSRIFEIDYNVQQGARILRYYIGLRHGDIQKALHLYNSGFKLRDTGYSKKVLRLFYKIKIK